MVVLLVLASIHRPVGEDLAWLGKFWVSTVLVLAKATQRMQYRKRIQHLTMANEAAYGLLSQLGTSQSAHNGLPLGAIMQTR